MDATHDKHKREARELGLVLPDDKDQCIEILIDSLARTRSRLKSLTGCDSCNKQTSSGPCMLHVQGMCTGLESWEMK